MKEILIILFILVIGTVFYYTNPSIEIHKKKYEEYWKSIYLEERKSESEKNNNEFFFMDSTLYKDSILNIADDKARFVINKTNYIYEDHIFYSKMKVIIFSDTTDFSLGFLNKTIINPE